MTFALRGMIGLALLAVAACQSAPPSFDAATLQPSGEDQSAIITGWLHVPGEGASTLTLYPTQAGFRSRAHPDCLTVRPLSIAGIVPPSYDGKQMSVQGQLTRDGAGECAMAIIASEITQP